MPPCNGKCVVCTAFNYSCRYVLYFCFCNKGSLCSFPHFDNFLNGDSFLCSLATKFNMHAEMDHLSPQKAPGVSPQTNVIKEELQIRKNSLFSLTTTFRLNVHAAQFHNVKTPNDYLLTEKCASWEMCLRKDVNDY